MAKTEWWRGATIYQVYPRSFLDTNGDGVGDLPGITDDVSDYTGVDPRFGSLADFDPLLARAHGLGLRVLIDQVWSHSSDRHPWFRESRSSRDNARADWYVWADPAPDGTPPNNWLSVFGGAAWTWEPRRRQYYLHHFLSQQPAFNLHNPAVMDALLQAGAFWLDRGVDGFRLDAVDFLLHDRALRSNPPAPWTGPTPAKLFALQEHRHDMLQPEATGLLARIRGLLDRYPGRVALGEISSQPGAYNRVLSCTAGQDRLHMAYTLSPLRGAFDWTTVSALVDAQAEAADGWPCWSFSNHDVERAVSRWNPERGSAPPSPGFARLLMALLLSLRGSVCLYQGEELGLGEAVLKQHELRDPFGIAYWPEFRGRDGSRTPMPWAQHEPQAGFSHGTPWLPVGAEHRRQAVDVQEADPHSLLHWTRDFLAWRRAQPALRYGTLTSLGLPAPLVGFVRRHEQEAVMCVFNLSNQPVALDPSLLEGTSPLHAGGVPVVTGATLPPFGASFARVPVLQPAPALIPTA
ncbi:MAG: alpha-glucosidase [Rhodospirillales bacterium]|nr:alpha-glucosidase [Rhodospirillales bacterium]